MPGQEEMATPTATAPRLTGVEPVLAVRDVSAAASYYQEVLDFAGVWLWGDPPTHGGANRDGMQLQFSLNPTRAETAAGQEVYISARHVEALYARHRERGAEIISPLEPKPWGVSQCTVRDLNGYLLHFAGRGSLRPRSPEGPVEVTIESRRPTWPEMEVLIHAVGWGDTTDLGQAPRALAAAVHGVVAVVEGRTIGCALLTADGAGYYQVRDVMVHPDWQARRVGTALMQALMDDLRTRVAARALIGLYTGTHLHDFYAQFGFRGPDHGPYGMTQEIAPQR
jgi:uncharacterized glyoxalase superfamily protein PhnB/predicted N-acetyltransferase YhbS